MSGLRAERGVARRNVEGFILYMELALTGAFVPQVRQDGKNHWPHCQALRAVFLSCCLENEFETYFFFLASIYNIVAEIYYIKMFIGFFRQKYFTYFGCEYFNMFYYFYEHFFKQYQCLARTTRYTSNH